MPTSSTARCRRGSSPRSGAADGIRVVVGPGGRRRRGRAACRGSPWRSALQVGGGVGVDEPQGALDTVHVRGGGGLERGAGDAAAHGIGLVGAADEEPHLAGRARGTRGSATPGSGAAWGSRARHRRVPVVAGRRVVREERGDVAVGPDAEHHDVEEARRRLACSASAVGLRALLGGLAAGRGRARGARWPGRARGRRGRRRRSGCRCGRRRRPAASARRPTTRAPATSRRRRAPAPAHTRRDDLRAHRAAGHRHVGHAARRLRVDEGHDEPGGRGVGQGLPAAVDDDGGGRTLMSGAPSPRRAA